MNTISSYDVILAGAGLSGLTLAVELSRRPAFRDWKILLIDRDDKIRNDRTWCFWATDEEPLPPVVFKTWEHCHFYSASLDKRLDMAPYRYRMVRGIDFYTWAKNELARNPHVEWRHADIQQIDAASGKIVTDQGDFEGRFLFNSALLRKAVLPEANDFYPNPPFSISPGAAYKGTQDATFLLQHFKGWIIETPVPVFDPEVVTFMDFRIEQAGETRFVYVLPFSPTRALVEFTVFSPALLRPADYVDGLRDYVRKYLKISDYIINEEEFGVIPMTDFPLRATAGGRLLNIGTAGGFVKASSGYAFKRTQRNIRALVDNWERDGLPSAKSMTGHWRFRLYDSVFLRVLHDEGALGSRVFSNLFEKLPAPVVLRFLDEDSTFAEELRVMQAPPRWPFTRAAFMQIPFFIKNS